MAKAMNSRIRVIRRPKLNGYPRAVTADTRLPRAFWAAATLFVIAASAWIAHRSNTQWDYTIDAGPPIDALAHLRLHEFLAARPDMGPLSLVLRAPFAALGQLLGSGGKANLYLDDYRFGVFPCLLACGIFGLALARFIEQRGRGPLVCGAVVVLATVNPVALRAIHFGHAEEALGAALLAGAMLSAVARRPWLATTLVALAVVNKQWGVIGLPAVLVVLIASVGWERVRRPILGLVAIMAALLVPLLIVDAGSLVDLTKKMADLRHTYVWPASIWHGIAPDLPPDLAAQSQPGLHAIPDWLGLIARPLIVAIGIGVPLAFARRVRQDVLHRAFPLLALVMLLRCALDPADNGYYHLPFFLAVLGADAIAGRFYATAIACVVLQAPTTLQFSPEGLAFFYAVWAPAFVVYLAGRSYGVDWAELVRSRGARGQTAARPATHSTSSAARS